LELCQAVRHASLEVTVALLALLTQSDDKPANALLADAIANAHVRIQKLRDVATHANWSLGTQLGRALTDTAEGHR
ncbi:MAG TPA: hypothetical protein VFZ53_23545, partial [Polyangiaceae bacterium]